MKRSSPFPVSGYIGPAYFCDREKEIRWLELQVRGAVPAVLIGVRRLGKTGLIRHFFHSLEKGKNEKGIFVDLQGTESFEELTKKVAEGISAAFPEKLYQKIWTALRRLQPVISFDPIAGTPQMDFQFRNEHEVRHTFSGLLQLLSDQGATVIIAFDEFQEIVNYRNKNVEGILRSEMQSFPHIRFLFSGSKTHLLNRMFQEGTRPFFGSVQKLYLEKLDGLVYRKFILRKFRYSKKNISKDTVDEIISWTSAHTYYTQYFCNQLFLESGKNVTPRLVDQIKWRILQVYRDDYYQLRDILPSGQWKVLVAVAKEEMLSKPTSQDLMLKYNLDTPRAVSKSVESLLDKQLIYQDFNESGEKFLALTNVFFMRFVQGYIH